MLYGTIRVELNDDHFCSELDFIERTIEDMQVNREFGCDISSTGVTNEIVVDISATDAYMISLIIEFLEMYFTIEVIEGEVD